MAAGASQKLAGKFQYITAGFLHPPAGYTAKVLKRGDSDDGQLSGGVKELILALNWLHPRCGQSPGAQVDIVDITCWL